MKSREEIIRETEAMVIANLSLRRPINIDDIKYAIEKGFEKGIMFGNQQHKEL